MEKTEATKKNYLAKATNIIKNFENSGYLLKSDPEKFFEWMTEYCKNLRSSTIRLYKACMVYYFEVNNAPIEYIQSINNISAKGKKNLPKRTSSHKNKKIEQSTYELLLERIQHSDTIYKDFLSLYFLANLFYGFRPVEWSSAKIVKKDTIRVKNAKATNGRGNGKYREITYPKNHEAFMYAKKLIKEIQRLLEITDWQTIYNSSRRLVLRLQEDIPEDKKITFYDTRHQLVANLKQTELDKITIANLLGHSSIKTASVYYGKKKHGIMIKNNLPQYSKPKLSNNNDIQ